MKLQLLDILIIALYLIGMVVIGLILKKRASQNMDSYFLGGKSLPFYMLGLSNASGQFDISGTMWMVTLAFVYGLKSAWVPWLWPVFNQVFLMVYLSVWLRRSNVLTGAEWIQTRFGTDCGARLSHTIVVVYALIGVLGFLSYGFIGVGKFMEIFFPWNVVSQFVPFDIPAEYVPHAYGIFFTAIATVYVILGGMFSIVWTDVVQFAIMTVAGITIAVIAMMKVSPETLAAIVPAADIRGFSTVRSFRFDPPLCREDILVFRKDVEKTDNSGIGKTKSYGIPFDIRPLAPPVIVYKE